MQTTGLEEIGEKGEKCIVEIFNVNSKTQKGSKKEVTLEIPIRIGGFIKIEQLGNPDGSIILSSITEIVKEKNNFTINTAIGKKCRLKILN